MIELRCLGEIESSSEKEGQARIRAALIKANLTLWCANLCLGKIENQSENQTTAEPSFPFAIELIHRFFHKKLCFQWIIICITYWGV